MRDIYAFLYSNNVNTNRIYFTDTVTGTATVFGDSIIKKAIRSLQSM